MNCMGLCVIAPVLADYIAALSFGNLHCKTQLHIQKHPQKIVLRF